MSDRFVVIPTSDNQNSMNRPIVIICGLSIILAIIFGYLWLCTVSQIKKDKIENKNEQINTPPAFEIPDEDLLKPEPLPMAFDAPETSYSGFDQISRTPMPQAQVQTPSDGFSSFDMTNPPSVGNNPSFDSSSFMPKAYGSKGSGKGVRIK